MKDVKKLDLGLTGYDELFMNEKERAENRLPKIYDIPLNLIDEAPYHTFQVRLDEDMDRLVDSIKERGVIVPAILREKDDGRYELVSGHRRRKACEIAGLKTLKAEIRNLTRDEAIILMVDSNLQRSVILPSEKAFSYKARYEAMKRQGNRRDLNETSRPVGAKLRESRTDEQFAAETGDSARQISRYIRLTELIPSLLSLVDEGRIALRPAVEISYLSKAEQEHLSKAISYADATPSHAQTILMRKYSTEGKLTPELIEVMLHEEKPNQKDKISFRTEKLRRFIPNSIPYEKTEDYVLKALEYYHRYLERKKEYDR